MDDRLALRFVTVGFRGIMTSILVGLTGSWSGNGIESTIMVSPSSSPSKVNVGAGDEGIVPTTEVGTMEESKVNVGADDGGIRPTTEVGIIEEASSSSPSKVNMGADGGGIVPTTKVGTIEEA